MRYVIGRLGQAVIVLAIAFTATFIMLQALPGDALVIRFESPEAGLGPDEIERLRAAYGANEPLWQQYFTTLGNFLRGDFGYSVQSGTPVSAIIASALPNTVILAASAFIVAAVLAVALAALTQLPAFASMGRFLRSAPSLLISVPVFWLGIVLVQVFSFRLGWIPIINPGPVQGLILPVVALAIPISAPIAQVLIRSIDDVRRQPFVTVVKARGASDWWILTQNVARNALLPALTMAALLLGELIGGAVVTETVFGRTGIGRVTEQAVTAQDTPVLQAVVVISAAVFVLVNLAVDLTSPFVDPRIVKSGARA